MQRFSPVVLLLVSLLVLLLVTLNLCLRFCFLFDLSMSFVHRQLQMVDKADALLKRELDGDSSLEVRNDTNYQTCYINAVGYPV